MWPILTPGTNSKIPLKRGWPRIVSRTVAKDCLAAGVYEKTNRRLGTRWGHLRHGCQSRSKIFNHFREATQKQMAISISRRFSTVQTADEVYYATGSQRMSCVPFFNPSNDPSTVEYRRANLFETPLAFQILDARNADRQRAKPFVGSCCGRLFAAFQMDRGI
ncbi:MAG: hypothetical protein ACI814_002926 [Mariniblastus sp.]|jgi:hypothetical protein